MNRQLYEHNQLIPMEQRDRELEELWAELSDVPFGEDEDGRLVLVDPWLHFPAGTWNEDIWRWFDERYSKGVYHLMYGFDGFDRVDHFAQLIYLDGLCFWCESKDCAFNNDGVCRYALVAKEAPTITDDHGCKSFCIMSDWSCFK